MNASSVAKITRKDTYITYFYRILRQRVCKTREKKQKMKSDKSASNERPGIYVIVGENGGYQELGYVSGPSHYDRL